MQYLVTLDDSLLRVGSIVPAMIAWDAARHAAVKTPVHAERLLTAHDVALILRRSESRVYELGIPCVRVGGNVRWTQSDVDSWIESHREYGNDRDTRGVDTAEG